MRISDWSSDVCSSDLDARVRGDGTALILASRQGKLAIVEALLEAGAGVDVASRGDGNPLIMAARAGNDDVVARLIEAGADPDAIVPDDETPLIDRKSTRLNSSH